MSLRCLLLVAALWFAYTPAHAQVAIDWVPMNEGLEGDQVDMLWQSPRGTFFAGGAYSGLFRSTSYREPWQVSALPKVHAREMTADASGNVYVAGDEGLFLSSDEGLTWRSTNLTVPVYALATTPDGNVFAGTTEGLYRRQSGEHSFSLIKQWFIEDFPAGSYGEEIEPITLMTVRDNGELVVAAASHLYLTKDGDSWSCLSLNDEAQCWEKRTQDGVGGTLSAQITTLGSFDNDLFVGNYVFFEDCHTSIYDSEQHAFVSSPRSFGYKVLDNTASGKAHYLVMELCNSQGFGGGFILFRKSKDIENPSWERLHEHAYTVAVDPQEQWICIGKNDGVYCSEDGGNSWTSWNEGLTNSEVKTLYPSDKNLLFAGTRHGMYLDQNTNASIWQPIILNQFHGNFGRSCISTPYAFADLPDRGFMAMGGGIFHANDVEDVWQSATSSINTPIFDERPEPFDIPFCGVTFDRYVGSITDGCSKLYSKTVQSDGAFHYRHPGSTLSYSSDGFVSSQRINLPAPYNSNSGYFVSSQTPLYFYSGNRIWKTENKGTNWSQLPFPEDSLDILDILATGDSTILAGTTSGLYRSDDAGLTWGSPVSPNQCFNLLTANDQGLILASDQLMSTDFGRTWHTIETPLTGYVTSMTFDDAGTLYAGTRGRGVFKSATPLHLKTPQKPATAPFTATLYPNPAPGDFALHLELPQLEAVRVDVYDLLGRHRGRLLDRTLSRGTHYLPLKRTGVASGSYVVRVSAGDQSRHLKLLFR